MKSLATIDQERQNEECAGLLEMENRWISKFETRQVEVKAKFVAQNWEI